MRFVFLLLLSVSLSACSLIYRLPTRQGNVLEQKELDKLRVGMTHEQVAYLLGTPLAASPFHADRWDYVAYYKSPRGAVTNRTVTLFFEGDAVTRMEGVAALADPTVAKPTASEIRNQQKKDELDAERAKENTKNGVIIGAPTPNP